MTTTAHHSLDEEGIGSIVFSPLAQGMLTDKYLDGVPETRSRDEVGRMLRALGRLVAHNRHLVQTMDVLSRGEPQPPFPLRHPDDTLSLAVQNLNRHAQETAAAAARAVVTAFSGLSAYVLMRWVFGLGGTRLSGVLAGMQTQPALLAYANGRTNHDPRVMLGYALVYPTAMIAKILTATVLAAL